MNKPTRYRQSELNPQPQLGNNFNRVDTIYKKTLKTVSIKIKPNYWPVTGGMANRISRQQQVFDILQPIFAKLDDGQEHLVLLVLNSAEVTGYKVIASGARDYNIIDMRVILLNAILLGADTMILAHNHTCGQTYASPLDIDVTEKIAKVARVLEIPLADHIIVTHKQCYSMRQKMPEVFRSQ
ncbi:MAG: DNA repair protein RadC [Phenylobacterium sp.]|jgi:DNA repair protein RadC